MLSRAHLHLCDVVLSRLFESATDRTVTLRMAEAHRTIANKAVKNVGGGDDLIARKHSEPLPNNHVVWDCDLLQTQENIRAAKDPSFNMKPVTQWWQDEAKDGKGHAPEVTGFKNAQLILGRCI